MIEAQPAGTGLYAHTKCPQWGLAILAWDRGAQKAFQFEDGKLRVFKTGYFELLQEVDRPTNETRTLIANLERKLGVSKERSEFERSAEGGDKPTITFDEQISIFLTQYPEGFQDKTWLSDKRGVDKRPLKRHRDSAIQFAKEIFSQDRCQSAQSNEEFADLVAQMDTVLTKTDLVSTAQRKLLLKMRPERVSEFGRSLADVIYGQDQLDLRVGRYFATFRVAVPGSPSWNLATALPALVKPTVHVCIKPNVFREQAAWLGSSFALCKNAK